MYPMSIFLDLPQIWRQFLLEQDNDGNEKITRGFHQGLGFWGLIWANELFISHSWKQSKRFWRRLRHYTWEGNQKIRISKIITYVTLRRGDEIINRKNKVRIQKQRNRSEYSVDQVNSSKTLAVTAQRHTSSPPVLAVCGAKGRQKNNRPAHRNLETSFQWIKPIMFFKLISKNIYSDQELYSALRTIVCRIKDS